MGNRTQALKKNAEIGKRLDHGFFLSSRVLEFLSSVPG